jgi:hypothetical protein
MYRSPGISFNRLILFGAEQFVKAGNQRPPSPNPVTPLMQVQESICSLKALVHQGSRGDQSPFINHVARENHREQTLSMAELRG